MSESTTEGPVMRSHIIKRPRLTRLLDETTARIILLIAPAGYGKTTLAREWCDSREGSCAWYRAGRSASDVAALATDLSYVMDGMVATSGESVRNYLRGSNPAEQDLEAVASLLAEDLAGWPDDALLVIDDYHNVAASEPADAVVGLFAEHAPIQILLASRRVPIWASARQFIYGEILEVDRDDLAMTAAEIDLAVPLVGEHEALRLKSLADGWPALIGLAALTAGANPPATAERLHAFFAQELFETATSDVQFALVMLAVLPVITRPLAEAALGKEPSSELSYAARAGFFTSHDGSTYELHPLLREFLLTKTSLLGGGVLGIVIERVLTALLSERRWDDAFAVIEEREVAEALPDLIRSGLEDLLLEGRVATVRLWTECAHRLDTQGPLIDLAEAEVALRSGDQGQANFFARRAVRDMPTDDEKRFRALALAGLTAHISDDYHMASKYYEDAEAAARSAPQIREALWGQFTTAHHLESERSEMILDKLESLTDEQTADDLLRIANGRFRVACLAYEPLRRVLEGLTVAHELIVLATNPHVICGFLAVHAQCLLLTSNYESALQVAIQGKESAEKYGLGFALPYMSTVQAFAFFGLKRFEDSSRVVESLISQAESSGDVLSLVNARVAGARLALAKGEWREAIATTDDRWLQTSTPAMRGESLAVHALALACQGHYDEAQAALTRARTFSRALEMETIAIAAEVVAELQSGPSRIPLGRLLKHVKATDHFDALVVAYRAYPPLLAECYYLGGFDDLVDEVLVLADDASLAAGLGIVRRDVAPGGVSSNPKLSPREEEVLGLVAVGLSNDQIAQRLYISPATVKVHLRHIFEKLGVRSRTQAALHPAAHKARYATSDISTSGGTSEGS